MEMKTLRRLTTVLTTIIVIIVAVSILMSNTMVSIAAIILGIAILFVMRTSVKDIIKDEMVYRISEKASRRAFQIFVLCVGLLGASILIIDELNAQFSQVAYAFLFSICLLLVIYLAFYFYYSKRGV